MRTDFLFKLLDGVGPVDRLGRLIVIGDILAERGLEGMRAGKVIRLQMFALQPTPPDFELIQPRCVGRQPVHLKVQAPFTRLLLLTEPPRELFGRMGSAIVQDEGHRVDLASKGFGNDHLLEKGLEIDEALAAAAGAVDLSLRAPGSCKNKARAPNPAPSFVPHPRAPTPLANSRLPPP